MRTNCCYCSEETEITPMNKVLNEYVLCYDCLRTLSQTEKSQLFSKLSAKKTDEEKSLKNQEATVNIKTNQTRKNPPINRNGGIRRNI